MNGLGKTIQALGIINADPTIRSALVLCAPHLRLQWASEARRWLARPFSVGVAGEWLPPDDLVILGYDLLRKWRDRLLEREYDLIVLDDAHRLRSSRTLRIKLANEVAVKGRRRLLLSGAPLFDRPVELYPLLKLLDPGAWPSFFDYARRYCAARHTGTGWDFSGASNIDELQSALRQTVLVRRLKSEALQDLPARRRQVIELPIGDAAQPVVAERNGWERQKAAMDERRAQTELAKTADDPESYRRAVEDMASGTRAAFQEIERLRHATALAKIPGVLEHVREVLEETPKVVLFALHDDVVQRLAKELEEQKPAAVTASTPVPERAAAVERFRSEPSCRAFIGTLEVAGALDRVCPSSHLIFVEVDHVPGNMQQAEISCRPSGAPRESLLIQHLVLEGSLDATMARAMVERLDALDRTLDTDFGKEVVAPGMQPSTRTTTRRFVDEEAGRMTPERSEAVRACLAWLLTAHDAGTGAEGVVSNEMDLRIIRELGGLPSLNPRQASLGHRIVQRYTSALPTDMLSRARGEEPQPAATPLI